MAKIIKIYPDNPSEKYIIEIVEVLKKDGIIVYPTDTVYGLGCDIFNHKAMEKLSRIKNVKLEKTNFSFVCNDLSNLSQYSKPINNNLFKLLKRALPGPFTFILNASNTLPSYYKNKKTVGIRIPDHQIPRIIVEKLGNPIASTSTHDDDEIMEYSTDPELIAEKYDKVVDIVIDSGAGGYIPSTVVDLTSGEAEILRQGKGDLDLYL
ncbi:L-threonylcarbamoyladenylate synthase [Apibacter sp.]|uniref:L-threonylcarbamoyladenylate synthase n=1 Tax=Apibacter sp. TaxID=2023709 RepID=UPI0026009C77|nr:L-threonylcarbamoyladenylate synthase [Apibacter sp.]MCT6868641.1 L-threonylcarbamoyladenylate synthase [Apibacter sp.]